MHNNGNRENTNKGGEHQGEQVDSSWLQKIFLQILLGSVESLWIWFEYDIWYTVCSIQFGLRNEAIVSLIWDFWGLKGLLCDPKTGRKLLLGQKHTEISFAVSQEED